jgi:hypothetical protein
MIVLFDAYKRGETIPVKAYIRNNKFAKYFNRQTAAAMVCAGKLFRQWPVDTGIPFYYETGQMEFEDYGLDAIVDDSLDEQGNFSQRDFVEKGTKAVTPLTQFKAMYNMPLSLLSIEYGLTGDNAVIYASARGLLIQALHAPRKKRILLGCGKACKDGSIEAAFAIVDKEEIRNSPFLDDDDEGIRMFRSWHAGGKYA